MFAEIDWGQGIEDAWASVVAFVPKLIAFALILVIGYVVVKLIATAVDRVLERVGFDRAVQRGGIGRMLESSRYDATDILSKVVFWTLFLFVLQLAFGVFGANPVSDLITGVIAYLPRVIAALLIVVVTTALAAFVRDLVGSTLGGLSYGRLLANVAGGAIIVFGAFAALSQLAIAPEIVNALFYALLAIVAGSAIVAIGGGGIAPMRQRWERAMQKYDEEKPRMQEQLRTAQARREHERQQLIDLSDAAEEQRGREAYDAQLRAQATAPRAPAAATAPGAAAPGPVGAARPAPPPAPGYGPYDQTEPYLEPAPYPETAADPFGDPARGQGRRPPQPPR